MRLSGTSAPKFQAIHRVEVNDIYYNVSYSDRYTADMDDEKLAKDKAVFQHIQARYPQLDDPASQHEVVIHRPNKLHSFKYRYYSPGWTRYHYMGEFTGMVTIHPDTYILSGKDARQFWEMLYDKAFGKTSLAYILERLKEPSPLDLLKDTPSLSTKDRIQQLRQRLEERAQQEEASQPNEMGLLYNKVDAAKRVYEQELEALKPDQEAADRLKPSGFWSSRMKRREMAAYKTAQATLDKTRERILNEFLEVQKELLDLQERVKQKTIGFEYFSVKEYVESQKQDAEGNPLQHHRIYSSKSLAKI